MLKKIHLILYYLIGKHLPASDTPFSFKSRRIRCWLGQHIFKYCGTNVNIEKGVFFGSGSDIEIGDNSGLGINARVSGPLKIGKNVMMGPEVIIYTRNHNFDRLDIPMIEQGDSNPRKVTIEDDVWIGARVIILPGVTIGKGAIIGAGSIVTGDIKPYTIAGGNPARTIRSRKETL